MKAMLLAAGEGTRLRPFTLRLPKPAIPFLGVPLADYSLRLLAELGSCDLVVNHHHLSNEILRLFYKGERGGRQVDFSDETSGLLGSGGGIHRAKSYLQNEQNFIVMNADEVILPHFGGQFREVFAEHIQSGRLATLLVIHHPEVGEKFGGAWAEANGRVREFSKTKIEGLTGWHYIGIVFLSNRIFSYFKPAVVDENLLYETLTLAMSKGEEVKVAPLEAAWFESGNPVDFKNASEVCLDEILSDSPKPWAQDLALFLAKQSLQPPVVEAEDLLLVKKLERAQAKIKGL